MDRRKIAKQHRQEQRTKEKIDFIGGIPSKEGFDNLYKRYIKLYNAAESKLLAGESMYLPIRTKATFKDLWLANYNQGVKDNTLKGKTPAETANWIVNKMVEEQKYFRSKEQAQAYQKGFEFFNQKVDVHGIRGGRYEAEIDVLEKDLEIINNAIKNKDEATLLKYFTQDQIADVKTRWNEYTAKNEGGYLRANFIGQMIFGS